MKSGPTKKRPCEDTVRRQSVIHKQGERPPRNQTCQLLDLGLPASRTVRNKFPLFKPPSLCVFYCDRSRLTKIMASGPITSRQIDGETVEIVADFIFGGSKITADGDCSHEIKRRLLLGRKVMTNLDSILKSRDYFVNKGLSSQGYGFSSCHVWM